MKILFLKNDKYNGFHVNYYAYIKFTSAKNKSKKLPQIENSEPI